MGRGRWEWGRIVSVQPTPIGDGSLYDIDLEIVLTGQDAPGPPGGDYSGDVFCGLQRSDHTGEDNLIVGYLATYDDPYVGFDSQATTGPIHVVESATPFYSIEAEEAMTVRIHARAQGAEVYIPPFNVVFNVTVNGVVVGTDSGSESGFSSWTREVDLRDFALEAGDVVSVTGSLVDDWGNLAVNETYLVVVRGDFTATTSGLHEGP